MTITIHYPIGDTVFQAEAEILPSGNFFKKRGTEKEIVRLGNSDEAYKFCEKIVGGRRKVANGIS